MTQAHAVQKGAVGLELGDERGHKEMIDAPMLKQVRLSGLGYPFVHLTFHYPGREDDTSSTRCWPSHSNTALRTRTSLSSSYHAGSFASITESAVGSPKSVYTMSTVKRSVDVDLPDRLGFGAPSHTILVSQATTDIYNWRSHIIYSPVLQRCRCGDSNHSLQQLVVSYNIWTCCEIHAQLSLLLAKN